MATSAAPFEVASRYFTEVYNEDRTDLIDTLFSPDYEHTSSDGRVSKGTARIAQTVGFIKQVFPHLHMTIQHHADNGDMSMMVVRYESDMPGFAAESVRDQKIAFDETFLFWVQDGKIVRGQSYGPGAVVAAKMAGFEGNIMDVVRVLSEHTISDDTPADTSNESSE
ncbi:MAG: nuclear transport factor 2 family protein [Lysobacteraceae bacterium]|nr:nuclear transport factor 2 family protein [Xanthomonadaceae bacterium]HRY01312.1 nuclear transport factor 2 family protein [Xanthomonadaceae bacterium]